MSELLTIVIENMEYKPPWPTPSSGKTVVWINDDQPMPHSATAVDKSFDTGKIPEGGAEPRRA